MALKRHTSNLTGPLVREIEFVLPKLKYSVYIKQVQSWLENFEEHEVPLALDFLFYLEYISFPELQARLNNQLNTLDKHFTKKYIFLLVPFAKYPKSNDIVMYLISKCPIFKKLETEGRIDITFDIENYLFTKETVLVYVDDFIGSGKSFQKWYRASKIASVIGSNIQINIEQGILAAIIMENGHQFMQHHYPEISVFADFRSKIFCRTHSPFNLSENRAAMRSLCLKYGAGIQTDFRKPNMPIYTPFGFENSEALVAFDYGTPNNSLSIIWGDNKWNPIFPRAAKSRMKKASQIKIEAGFYLGLLDKLEMHFNEDIEMTIDSRNVNLSARDDHSIIVYMLLTDKLYTPLLICQVLGITIFELKKIVSKARQKLLVNKEGGLTRLGSSFLSQLKKTNNVRTFRKNDKLEVKEDKIFVPKTFGNMT